jgi:hypothetical protein
MPDRIFAEEIEAAHRLQDRDQVDSIERFDEFKPAVGQLRCYATRHRAHNRPDEGALIAARFHNTADYENDSPPRVAAEILLAGLDPQKNGARRPLYQGRSGLNAS